MQVFAETERLILRELLASDAKGLFAVDSNPDVHTYLGNNPVKTLSKSKMLYSLYEINMLKTALVVGQ